MLSDEDLRLEQSEEARRRGSLPVLGKMQFGFGGRFGPDIWVAGTKHVLLSHVKLGRPDVDFYSDPTRLLVFRNDLAGGYAYQSGGGGVIHVHAGRSRGIDHNP